MVKYFQAQNDDDLADTQRYASFVADYKAVKEFRYYVIGNLMDRVILVGTKKLKL
ncbi:hypothetical protein [Flavobacterium limi]|uniref:Uncharacterized protein n=1 Tax=Flavobacterium limi TaxID=2045105 RepID=A0ABQ1UW60_9FLAO|nr:hypothetical protein [Flavobacterium limi]GGF28561.1 hypothetical protein GCM10011518_42380 [Flavobacterium limi]